MASFSGYTALRALYSHHLQLTLLSSSSHRCVDWAAFFVLLHSHPSFTLRRCFSTGTESAPSEFSGPNAYELLGVAETSSFSEIKASFRKLAKETHPDLAQSHDDSSSSTKSFVQILAAYEILSDSKKRAHYDQYLLSQRKLVQKHAKQYYVMYNYEFHRAPVKQMEVVEWLVWYREAVKDILAEERVVVGSGYFDALERDFYSAIHSAYYGPEIEATYLLPERFEAEVRSEYGTPEVLHLVCGRELFGMVCVSEKIRELSHGFDKKLASSSSYLCCSVANVSREMPAGSYDTKGHPKQVTATGCPQSDAYKDLELHILGKRVAVATRFITKNNFDGIQDGDLEDQIHVYLTSSGGTTYSSQEFPRDTYADSSDASSFHLGTITGLGTSPEEGSCSVFSNSGVKTHVVMKHRTLLVKHMHWYQVGDEVSVCECRCSRARLPPSKYFSGFWPSWIKFWLFEPRCGMHDIGGWYVETFGRDKKGRTAVSQRFWDGLHNNEQRDERLHPAVYLLGLAYRTLDIEDARRRKRTIQDILGAKMYRILKWCKKLV